MSDVNPAGTRGLSPASTGPAGAHFEAQVGASCLLAMLTGGEPRGLPGMVLGCLRPCGAVIGQRIAAASAFSCFRPFGVRG
jgi:hypothetical protein